MYSGLLAALLLVSFNVVAQVATSPEALVPKVDLLWWNGEFQWDNNCYNYGTNRRTNSYAQPGEASGAMYDKLDCPSVHLAAATDLGLTPTEHFAFSTNHDDTLVALVVSPDQDYHWYRRDADGLWTHKMGGTPATNLDNSKKIITSVEKADRGNYTEFCGYFRIKNYKYEENEQNGGFVRIGDMLELPALPNPEPENIPNEVSSYVEVLKYSGRRNPRHSLQKLLNQPGVETQLRSLTQQLEKARAASDTVVLEMAKLGYNGILIADTEGVLFQKGTRIQVLGTKVLIYYPGNKRPLSLNLARELSLEYELSR